MCGKWQSRKLNFKPLYYFPCARLIEFTQHLFFISLSLWVFFCFLELTRSSSCLSSLRANTRATTYNPSMVHTVDNTTKFPVSARLPNAANTLSKSMGFGATKKSPPKADRWVHRQCNCKDVVFGPTYSNYHIRIIKSDLLMVFGFA